MRLSKFILGAILYAYAMSNSAVADEFISPEILILGDSQISFGSVSYTHLTLPTKA